MVDLITNDLNKDILEMRRCPRCGMTTTFIHLVAWKKDEGGDTEEDDDMLSLSLREALKILRDEDED